MKTTRWLMSALFLGGSVAAVTDPFLRVVEDPSEAVNLARNAGFEAVSGDGPAAWRSAPQGFQWDPRGGRGDSRALACGAPDSGGWRGASQTITLDQPSGSPIIISGWSRAVEVEGGRDSGYSLYADLTYADNTPLWGQTANFSPGTHDWERREVLILPAKPVKSLTQHCLFRGHAGRVWFDDVRVAQVTATEGALLFQGRPMRPAASSGLIGGGPTETWQTKDGLGLELRGQRVERVRVGEREWTAGAAGGFFARDVAADSDLFGFDAGACPALGLGLETRWVARDDHLAVRGRLKDLRGGDRAVLLLFALPVAAHGWLWGDDIRRERVITGKEEYCVANAVDCGTTGTLSAYPMAAIHDRRSGLALALDPDCPAQFRLVYHAGTRQFFIAFDFGLVPETAAFPGAADFGFVVYRFDPAWGFRAAWEKHLEIFPEHHRVRSTRQGIWMPFTDVRTVEGWEDFGFRYHEGNNNVPWDDEHDILSFRYTEPMTWWMSMDPAAPRTLAEALRIRDEYAASGGGRPREMAAVSRAAAMFGSDDRPTLTFRNEPWANGAVWSLNPNPALPATPNAATIHWNDAVKARAYAPGAVPRLDGEYLDSLEGYVTANLNFRREHFRFTSVPLTFATDTHAPALFKGLAVHEFTRWISEDVRRLGGLMFANGVPYRFGFLCPWLDVLGTETNWMPDGRYTPASHEQMGLWRTLAGRKPYLLLMNTDYDRFGPPWVERYFQRSLFYGMFPSMFSHNAAEDPYWRNPAWYNRDRELFRRYIPLIKQVAEAGWQPVTRATTDNPDLLVERFGPAPSGHVFFTVFNDSEEVRAGRLRVETPMAGVADAPTVRELVSDRVLSGGRDGWEIRLAGGAVAVIRL